MKRPIPLLIIVLVILILTLTLCPTIVGADEEEKPTPVPLYAATPNPDGPERALWAIVVIAVVSCALIALTQVSGITV